MKKVLTLTILVSFIFGQNPIVDQFSTLFSDIVDDVNESVVTITAKKTYSVPESAQNLYRFWGRDLPDSYEGQSLGSGVIVDSENGYIVTNHHVVFDNGKPVDEIIIQLMDKRMFDAQIIGLDEGTDLAILQIQAEDIKSVKVGDSDNVRVGEWVLAIGSPFSANLSHTVTAGIVSAVGRDNVMMRGGDKYQDFIQTDAAINPGNSGGALLNMNGELIGINAAIISGSRSNSGVGFAIPSNIVTKVKADLISKGYVVRSFLGIYMQDINEEIYEAMDLDSMQGAIIGEIVSGSPAEEAGLEASDIIIGFENKTINNGSELKNLISNTKPGSKVKLNILRSGNKKDIYVVLKERQEDSLALGDNYRNKDFGLVVSNISKDLIDKFDISPEKSNRSDQSELTGVIITELSPKEIADKAGFKVGDLITRIGQKKVSNIKDFEQEINAYEQGKRILVLVKRGKLSRFLTLRR